MTLFPEKLLQIENNLLTLQPNTKNKETLLRVLNDEAKE